MGAILGFIGMGAAAWYQVSKENAESEAQMKKSRDLMAELAFMGEFYEEDEYDEGFTLEGTFFPDKTFSETTIFTDDDFRITLTGTWRVEDMYFYQTLDEEFHEEFGEEEDKYKIISYDEFKIIYEYKGKKYTRYMVNSALARQLAK